MQRFSRATLICAFGIWLAACGPRTSHVQLTPPPPEPTHDEIVRALNQQALEGGTEFTLHGTQVADPFRALENDDPFTQHWVAAQNTRTAAMLESTANPDARRERLATLLSIGTVGGVRFGGERLFYMKRSADEERPNVYVRDGEEERRLIDVSSFGDAAAIDWFFPSRSGEYVAYGVSQQGDERSTLYILKVDDGEQIDTPIERTKWSNLAWLPDDSGFYYTRYPAPGEEDYDPSQPESYFPRVFFHALGSADDDPRVFGAEQGTHFPSMHVSSDGRYVTLTVFRGWSESDVYLFDRGPGGQTVPSARRGFEPVIVGEESITSGGVFGGKLLLRTNKDAPRYRIVEANPRSPSRWRDRVTQRAGTLDDWAVVGDSLVLHMLEDVRSTLRILGPEGERELELPAVGAVGGLASSDAHARIAFSFQSYVHSPRILQADVGEGSPAETLVAVDAAGFEASDYSMTRARATSADGTEVPLTLVHRGELNADGLARVLLYGYGGFNIALLPRFTRHALYWIEQGGVFAVANLRGGGEFGESWHQAGNLANKERVFEDFEGALRFLGTDISSPERIAILGGSNGGLLVGATLTRSPELFAAGAAYVGLFDMVRYHHFPPAELWITEYGSADDAEMFPVLHGYSPYHNVRDDVRYPATLIETADHDSRVFWGHSTKFAAALQHANPDGSIYFHMSEAQGHGAGTSRADLVEKYVRLYGYLETALAAERTRDQPDQVVRSPSAPATNAP